MVIIFAAYKIPVINIGVVKAVNEMVTALFEKQAKDTAAGMFANEDIVVLDLEGSVGRWRRFIQESMPSGLVKALWVSLVPPPFERIHVDNFALATARVWRLALVLACDWTGPY